MSGRSQVMFGVKSVGTKPRQAQVFCTGETTGCSIVWMDSPTTGLDLELLFWLNVFGLDIVLGQFDLKLIEVNQSIFPAWFNLEILIPYETLMQHLC